MCANIGDATLRREESHRHRHRSIQCVIAFKIYSYARARNMLMVNCPDKHNWMDHSMRSINTSIDCCSLRFAFLLLLLHTCLLLLLLFCIFCCRLFYSFVFFLFGREANASLEWNSGVILSCVRCLEAPIAIAHSTISRDDNDANAHCTDAPFAFPEH